ncbi:MAG: hypothetical protein ABL967_10040 [Bryobacteraceae bacterium]
MTLLERIGIVGLALILLVPCFWHAHIQAGDLSSHIYNAWLANQVRDGSLPGIEVRYQWTNTLADWIFPVLLRWGGRTFAERGIAVFAVQLFFWGAFCFLSTTGGRRAWPFAPVLAMLAYGTVFQLGFLNFYLSTGFCLWMLTALWDVTRPRMMIAFLLAALALVAHVMPLLAVIFAIAYLHLHRRFAARWNFVIFGSGFASIAFIAGTLPLFFRTHWSWDHVLFEDGLLSALGAGQFWPYGSKYAIPAIASVILGFVYFLRRFDHGQALRDPMVHLWMLSIAAVAFLPGNIAVTGFTLPLEFIPVRLSLFVVLAGCAAFCPAGDVKGLNVAAAAVAAAYFTCLYLDASAWMRVEAEITALVSAVPPNSRVVAAVRDRQSRYQPLTHVASAACMGHCYDYANYEALSGMFRLRAGGPNPALPGDITVVTDIEDRPHLVTESEAPLYSICPAENGAARFQLRKLSAGEWTCHFALDITSQIF